MNATKKQPGKQDMFLDSHFKPQGTWVRTRIMTEAGTVTPRLSVALVRCDVGDPNRFGYLNGAWWRLESPLHDGHAPVASGQASSFKLTEADDTNDWQRLTALFPRRTKGGA